MTPRHRTGCALRNLRGVDPIPAGTPCAIECRASWPSARSAWHRRRRDDVRRSHRVRSRRLPHAQHIHGIVNGEDVHASACPPASADEDGDGVITVAEGAPFYGGVQVSLTTEGDTSGDSGLAVERFPAGSDYTYSRSGIPIPDALKPNLGKMHIVVHGVDENGDGELNMDQEERSSLTDDLPREATAPALCGTLTAQASTVQIGLGGDAGTELPSAFLVGGLLALAGTGIAVRRDRSAA